jgi:hypothetical protein
MIRSLLLLVATTIAVVTAVKPITLLSVPASVPTVAATAAVDEPLVVKEVSFEPPALPALTSGLPPCYGDATFALNDTTGQFGCQGTSLQRTITWTLSDDKTRIVSICMRLHTHTHTHT